VLDPLSTSAPQTRHAVTAIIVAHDGARWLPGLVQAIRAQTYPVDQAVGVDTASRDRSGAVLAELIGQDAVFGMDRSTGYGDAVAVAVRHATRRRSGQTDPNLNRVEWIWLLHDDCEPAPDALEQMLRAASKDRSVVVLGPKVLDGQDRRSLREVGISIDRAGRRVTGIDPGEIDQGQHDHKKAVLAVGSAGMLVRRDIWEQLGGFDTRLRLFRDDLDFCWRVQSAGYRVHVVTDAVVYHRELSARRRRPTEGGHARRIDRRNALFVLAVNLPLLAMLRVVGGCVIGSLARAFYFLITKQLDLAAAHAFAVFGLFAHPIRLFKGRRRRARGRADGYTAVRLFIPPARTMFRLAEKIAGLIGNGPPQSSGGRHHASAEESEEDEQFVDTQSLMRRFIGHPGVQLFTALLLVSLIAERRLLGTSPLGGGALVPAWGGAGALWHEYLSGFHTVGVGSTASAQPYLAVVGALASILGGQAWLAVDVLLLGCVPLAGMTAYLATRWIVSATPARVLLAASYALAPVATGAIAAGRLGTAVAFIMLPLIAVSAGRMVTATPRQAQRAAWATGLLIGVTAAFAPLAWPLGLVFAVGVLSARRWLLTASPVNALIVAVVPFVVLFPWSLYLLRTPAAWVSEVGVPAAGLTTASLKPQALLALSPGGPGLPPIWVTAGFGLAVLSLLLPPGGTTPRTPRGLPSGGATPRTLRGLPSGGSTPRTPGGVPARRTELAIAGWVVAIVGFLAAVLLSRTTVTPPAGGQAGPGWPGFALALAALGLLVAAAPAAQWLAETVHNGWSKLSSAPDSAGRFSALRKLLAWTALAAAATAPVFVAVYWVSDGVRGPVGSVAGPVLPAFVSASSTTGQQYRTLILRPDGATDGGLDYAVVRQGDPTLGEPELTGAQDASQALSRQVAALGAPDGADAGDPGNVLGTFGIRWVLLPGPVNAALAQRLDAAVGLVAQSKAPTYDLWEVAGPVARARVVAADGTVTALPSNPETLSGDSAPVGGGELVLAEPYGGWTATLNGHDLKPVATPVGGWAQGFVLPAGGGQLSISRDNLPRALSLLLELVAVAFIAVCALPGKQGDPAEEAAALAALRAARLSRRTSRTARRGVALPAISVAALAGGKLGRGRGHRSGQVPDQDARLAAAGLPDAGFPDAGFPGANLADPEFQEAGSAREPGLIPAEARADADAGDYASPAAAYPSPPADYPSLPVEYPSPSGDYPSLPVEYPSPPVEFPSPPVEYPSPSGDYTSVPAARAQPSPWDMAGDWTSSSRPDDADPWRDGADAWNDTPVAPRAGQQPPPVWQTGPQQRSPWGSGPQRPPSRTGAQPTAPADPEPSPTGAWDTGTASGAWDVAAPQPSAWQPEAQRPASSTGSQPRYPRDSQAQDPVVQDPGARTGSQPRYPRDSGALEDLPQAPISPDPLAQRPVSPSAQPRYPWDSRSEGPVSPTGSQPRYPWDAGAQDPVTPTGSQPRYPYGSASRASVPQDLALPPGPEPDYPWDSRSEDPGPPTGPQRHYSRDGESPAPVSPDGASGDEAGPDQEADRRPERQSHRAGKHGKPSRWHRSGGGGGS
jgi:GT2 family glycosyltransferase